MYDWIYKITDGTIFFHFPGLLGGFQAASLGPEESLETCLSLPLDMKLLMCFQTSGWFSIEALEKNSLPSVQFLTDVLGMRKLSYTVSWLNIPIKKKE